MDCKISVAVKDSDYQMPQYIKRIEPESDTDSGFRFYIGCEKSHNPTMFVVGDHEQYMKDMGLWELLHDVEIGYRVDIRSSRKAYPHIQYKEETLRFTPKGLMIIHPLQSMFSGVEKIGNGACDYIIPFEKMSFEEKKSILWKDGPMITKIYH